MTRSERLAKEGKISVYIGTLEIATVISDEEFSKRNLHYISTDFEAMFDGYSVQADVYEDALTDELFAILTK